MKKINFQCITEAERYSAKGFVAKPEKNKGAQKQEIWTECIQELSERPNFDRNTKNVLQRIATQSNVPRKKPKFINFLKSSMRFNPAQAEKIWTIIEKGLEEFKKKSLPPPPPPQLAGKSETSEPATENDNSVAENGQVNETEENGVEQENNTNGSLNEISLASVIEHALTQSNSGKNMKKTLKKILKRTDVPLNVQLPKKKKFVKFLQEQLESDAESSNAVWEIVSQSIQTLSSPVNNVPNELNGKTSKKRKNENDSERAGKKSKIELSLADSTTDANGESTFNWQKHILRIFNKNQTNNQLAVVLLKSKVIKKFLKSIGENESNSIQYEKTFKKNLKKTIELTSAQGVVQLKP